MIYLLILDDEWVNKGDGENIAENTSYVNLEVTTGVSAKIVVNPVIEPILVMPDGRRLLLTPKNMEILNQYEQRKKMTDDYLAGVDSLCKWEPMSNKELRKMLGLEE